MATETVHQPKGATPTAEDGMLSQAVEFLRQADAKKRSRGFWGPVTVTIDYEDGLPVAVDLNDGVTLRKPKKR